jgi:hypothetical protein
LLYFPISARSPLNEYIFTWINKCINLRKSVITVSGLLSAMFNMFFNKSNFYQCRLIQCKWIINLIDWLTTNAIDSPFLTNANCNNNSRDNSV